MIKRVSMGHREIQFLGYRLVDGTGDDSTRKFSNSLMLPYFSFPGKYQGESSLIGSSSSTRT